MSSLASRSLSQSSKQLTPMMQQYKQAKAEHPEAILMFRMGDFYEMFFEDAEIASKTLEIALTARDKNRSEGGIPMAGVPHHAATSYIARLLEYGHTVAICDQVEDPKKAKGLVKREITRLITPGTVCDFEALDPISANYIAYIHDEPNDAGAYAIALLELLAGEILICYCEENSWLDELTRMGVSEILLLPSLENKLHHLLGPEHKFSLRCIEPESISVKEASALISQRFPDHSLQEELDNYQQLALMHLLKFVDSTQRRKLKYLLKPRIYQHHEFMALDETTQKNLELIRTHMDGQKHGTLLWHLNQCRTSMGTRLLSQWLLFPLKNIQRIEQRLGVVQLFKEDRTLRQNVQRLLKNVRDVERLLGRITVGRATPRDVGSIRDSLHTIPEMKCILMDCPTIIGEKWQAIDDLSTLRTLLNRALEVDLPLSTTEGHIFKIRYCKDLDALIQGATQGHDYLDDLEKRERKRTNINKLKVRYNRVFGYYIEVTKSNLPQVPVDYIRKQTLVGSERFITEELKEFEDKVLSADERRKSREQALFYDLLEELLQYTDALRQLSRLIAQTDVLASLGQIAEEGRYVRPQIESEPILNLVDCRHPVLEQLMLNHERFVPNDVKLDTQQQQLLIITGPNMAGKSTIMRTTAHLAILAHMGSFVPAKRAQIGLIDRIFTRVGAADNLGKGRSTFMVEMLETATILKYATRQSLILLDEIGRGTSTFDGVSIAWAVAEYLHDQIGCRALFATHYHELTELAKRYPRIFNASVSVQEHNKQIVFLRRLIAGASNRSYGIQVARLAGLPETVLNRAQSVLNDLELGTLDAHGRPFVPKALIESDSKKIDKQQNIQPLLDLKKALHEIDPLHLTPLDALVTLDRLKKMMPTV